MTNDIKTYQTYQKAKNPEVLELLLGGGIPFLMVNPMHVNRSKELNDNLQTTKKMRSSSHV